MAYNQYKNVRKLFILKKLKKYPPTWLKFIKNAIYNKDNLL